MTCIDWGCQYMLLTFHSHEITLENYVIILGILVQQGCHKRYWSRLNPGMEEKREECIASLNDVRASKLKPLSSFAHSPIVILDKNG